MRAMPGDLKGEIILDEWGYSCSMTPWGELYLAFETGIVDGDINNTVDNMYTYFRDVLNCWVETKTMACFGTEYYTHDGLWNSLSAADQKLMIDNIQWAVDECVKREPGVTEARLKQWEEEGCMMVYPTKAQLDTLEEYTKENVWPRLADLFDRKYVNMIFEDLGLPAL